MNLLDLMVKIGVNDMASSAITKLANKTKQAVKVASAALGAFTVMSVNTGMNFDSAMSQVAATLGYAIDELSDATTEASKNFTKLRDKAQEMGASTAFSATQAAEALNYMALAGYDADTSIAMLPNVLNLAAAGNMDLARASDMVTDTQTAFGISLERTTKMVDEMAKAASTGNTSVEQLGDAFLTVGGLTKELNGGFITLSDGTVAAVDGVQELEIALTAMANAGVKGSEAGTHMRNMILKLSTDGEKALEELGITSVKVYDEATGAMRPFSAIMKDLSGALSTMTQQEKIEAIGKLFNARDISSAEALLAAVEEDWDAIGESILNADGAAAKMAAMQLDNLKGDLTILKSATEGFQIAISDKLTPTLREFAQFGSEALSEMTMTLKNGDFGEFADKVAELLQRGLDMINEKLPQFLDAGMKILAALARGLLQALPTLIKGLSDGIVQMIKTLSENTDAMLKGALELFTAIQTALFEAMPDILAALVDLLMSLVQTIGEHAPDILEAGFELITNLAIGIVKCAGNVLSAIGSLLARIVESPSDFIGDMISAGMNLIGGLIQGIRNSIGRVLDVILGGLKNAVQGALEFLGIASPSKLFEWVGDMTMLGLAEGIEDSASKAVLAMEDAAEDIYGAANGEAMFNVGVTDGGGNERVREIWNVTAYIQADSQTTVDNLLHQIQMARLSYGRA